MSQALLNGMLIQPTENGFVVTEYPRSGPCIGDPRMWCFETLDRAMGFVQRHFEGSNAATKPLERPVEACVAGGTLGQAADHNRYTQRVVQPLPETEL